MFQILECIHLIRGAALQYLVHIPSGLCCRQQAIKHWLLTPLRVERAKTTTSTTTITAAAAAVTTSTPTTVNATPTTTTTTTKLGVSPCRIVLNAAA